MSARFATAGTAAWNEPCRLAINLAKNCGYAVFPCKEDKTPACPHGFKDASKDPETITELWRRYPGPLIGIATGAVSGIIVADIDSGHDQAGESAKKLAARESARWFWKDHRARLGLPGRVFGTRSAGLHIVDQYREGVECSTGRIAPGVDVRSDGGYIIHWFAAGFPCWDHSPPAEMPDWLYRLALPKPAAPPPILNGASPEAAIAGIIARVAAAPEGERNSLIHWAACRLIERGVSCGHAMTLLAPAAFAAGLTTAADQAQTRRTIASAYRSLVRRTAT